VHEIIIMHHLIRIDTDYTQTQKDVKQIIFPTWCDASDASQAMRCLEQVIDTSVSCEVLAMRACVSSE
jgi:hypothetical protein